MIRYKNNGHSIFVTGVNGDIITYGDCNSDNHCKIGWNKTISKATVQSTLTAVYSAPSELSIGSTVPPSNPQISKNQQWYDLRDTIKITAYADGATRYYMSMFKGEERIKGEHVSGGKFTMAASDYGIGDYSVYFTCSNDEGRVDTSWLTFSVVGEPGYSDVWTSKPIYSLEDTVSISVSPICSKGQVIGIDKNGIERVITEQSETTYSIPAAQLGVGQYSAYFSVYNGSGSIDTERVEFIISESGDLEEVLHAEISLNSNEFGLEDTLEVTTTANGQVDCYTIQIWNGSQLVYSEESEENTFSVPCNTIGAGQFVCYVSCTNSVGTVTSEVVDFRVADYLKNPQIVIKNNKLTIEDSLEVSASAEGGVDYYTIQIWSGEQLVHSENFTGHEYVLSCEELGTGSYACNVLCTNASGNVKTTTENFTIGELSNLQVSINETKLSVEDVLMITTSVEGGVDYYTIQIWKNDELTYSEEFTGHNFTLACEELGSGEYACYVTAVNSAGTIGSEVYTFSISEETEDNTDLPRETGAFSITSASGKVGETVEVYIKLTDNPGIVGATLAVQYDASKLELVSCEDLGILNDYQFSAIDRNPFLLNWEDPLTEENNTENGNIAKLQFKILEDLGEDGAALQISIDTAYDVNIEDVEFTTSNGKITMKSYTPGDVNEDGIINSKDSILLRKYILGGNAAINVDAADVNRDGVLNSKDSIILRKYILGSNVELK